jgi:hypothetical protein
MSLDALVGPSDIVQQQRNTAQASKSSTSCTEQETVNKGFYQLLQA